MVNKNIQMKHKNTSGVWDDLYPITKTENVFDSDGKSVKHRLDLLDKKVTWKSVLEYGAIGDGVADDTNAFQDALNSGGTIFVPNGVYRITSTLEIPVTVVLVGLGFSIDANKGNASVLHFDNNVAGSRMFHSDKPNSKFIGLYFKGNNLGTDRRTWNYGFVFDKGTVYGDTDITFVNCHFFRFRTSIILQGRGLEVSDCNFVEQWDPIILRHFNNDEVTNPPSYDWQTNIRGFRKFHFINNRFHSCQGHSVTVESTSSNNYEKHIHQVVYTGNRHDGTGGIWKGYLGGATFSGNTLGKSGSIVYGQEMPIFNLNGAKGVTITGNSFSSELDMSNIMSREIYLGDIMLLNSGGEYVNITVVGNSFTGLGKRLVHAMANVTNLNFSDNTVDGLLLEKPESIHRPFHFYALGKNIVIKNNVIRNVGGTSHDYLAYFNNRGVQGCSIEGNITESGDFVVTHNLYPYNMIDNVLMNNYNGNGDTTQVLTFDRPILFVIISDYGATPKTIMKRVGTSNGNQLVEIVDNTVTVKGAYNTSGVAYSIVVYTV